MNKRLLPALLVGVALSGNAPRSQSVGQRPLVTGLRAMVTSNHPLASAAGIQILLKGGNVFDAAVAAAAATSVVDPASSGLGGHGYATLYVAASRKVSAVNAYGTAPKAARRELYTNEKQNEGILASPVPSVLRGYETILKTYGTKTLAEVFEPAIELAERGFLVTHDFARSIERNQERLKQYPTSARVFLPGGRPPAVGTLFIQSDYARTLRQVAQRGVDDFYRGDLAKRIAGFYREQGGILTLEDLQTYQAKWVEPISIPYRGYVIYTQPPNASALAMLEYLNIMEGFDTKSLGHNSAGFLHRLMEAIRLALSDRNRWVADPDAVRVPIAQLLSKDYARKQRERIRPDQALPVITPGDLTSSPYGDTTSLAVADGKGNMIALQQTLGGGFGSGIIVADTGLFFSNQMRHMHLEPASPSQIRGGFQPRSNASPTIILKDDQPVMAVESPGGDEWQRVGQVIINVTDFGMDIQEAVSLPRIYYGDPPAPATELKPVWIVEDRVAPAVVEQLRQKRQVIRLVPIEGGAVTGIFRDPRTGALTSGADPRGKSYAIGY